MHMADALVSPAVGGIMLVASGAAIAYSIQKTGAENDLDPRTVPVMGVMSAFVFAAQMINFTIPGTGSSGHLGGGLLLAALLGPYASILSISSVLLIQALFFADGGLLALGCNVFNMGVLMSFVVYPLLFRPILAKSLRSSRILLASFVSAVVGLQLGAFGVVLETTLSGVTALPFQTFLLLMQPIHLAIGLVEGLVTATILIFLANARPELLVHSVPNTESKEAGSWKRTVGVLAILTLLIAGGVSLLASGNPDGLEWSIEGVTGEGTLMSHGTIYEMAKLLQNHTAVMPDYSIPGSTSSVGTSLAGLLGSLFTITLAGGSAFAIAKYKKRKRNNLG